MQVLSGSFEKVLTHICVVCIFLADILSVPGWSFFSALLNDLMVLSITRVLVRTRLCLCGNSLSHFIKSHRALCMVLIQLKAAPRATQLVFGQILLTHLLNWPFHCRLLTSAHDWTAVFSTPLTAETVRFSVVVEDLTARAVRALRRKFCVYLSSATGHGELTE